MNCAWSVKPVRILPVIFLLMLTLIPSLSLIKRASAEVREDAVIAEVGDEKITLGEFREAARQVSQRGEIGLKKEEKDQLLENMIVERLLYKEALNKGLDKNPDVIRAVEKAKRDIVARFLLSEEIAKKVSVTQEEVNSYYNKHIEKFTPSEQATINYLNVLKQNKKGELSVEDARKIAYEIRDGLSKGKAIDELKKPYKNSDSNPDFSESISSETSAAVSKGKYYSGTNFDAVVFNLKPGEAGVVELSDRFMVILLKDRVQQLPSPLKDVEISISGNLKQEKWTALFKEYIAPLKERGKIKVHSDLIK